VIVADLTIVIGPIVAAILAPLVAYWFTRRVNRTDLRTTEAGQLWDESKSIRGELRHDVETLQGQVTVLLNAKEELRLRIVHLENTIERLEACNTRLHAENTRLKEQLA
jgi:chromosome segregation ATPase